MTFRHEMAAFLVVVCAAAWCLADDARQPAGDPDLDRQIAHWIEQLGDSQYATRQRAQDELVKIGFDAFDALCEAENSDDPEIAMQAGYLVRKIRVDWTSEDDPRQIQLILKDYETQPLERRLVRIKQLAELPGGQGLEWLCRIVRFEESPVLSKQAALAILQQVVPAGEAASDEQAALLRKHMERSHRPAAGWLLAHLDARQDPAGNLARWSDLTEAERQTLESHPQETTSRIVIELLLAKVALLDRLGRPDDVEDVMHQMVLCERGDATSLGELVNWLSERKAWSVIDDVATRFSATFDLDAMLLYTLSEARRRKAITSWPMRRLRRP